MKKFIRIFLVMVIVCGLALLERDIFTQSIVPVISEETDISQEEVVVTMTPTASPTTKPTSTPVPTPDVTIAPTATPTVASTATPTVAPTATPTVVPTATPTVVPTATPTVVPTATPTVVPTATPTVAPTATPVPQATETPSDTKSKKIAFTFDDGPSKYTTQIMDAVESYGGHATFFVVGSRVSQYSDIILDMYNRGHEIANHSWNHPNLKTASKETIIYQIESTQNAVYNITGQYPTYLRPPYGAYDELVKEVASSYNLKIKLWTIDTLDWKYKNAEKVKNAILKNAKDGSVILLHDLYKTSADGAILAMKELDKQGYEFVTVSQL